MSPHAGKVTGERVCPCVCPSHIRMATLIVKESPIRYFLFLLKNASFTGFCRYMLQDDKSWRLRSKPLCAAFAMRRLRVRSPSAPFLGKSEHHEFHIKHTDLFY